MHSSQDNGKVAATNTGSSNSKSLGVCDIKSILVNISQFEYFLNQFRLNQFRQSIIYIFNVESLILIKYVVV